MATGGYRNGGLRGQMKIDRPLSVNNTAKSASKSRQPPAAFHHSTYAKDDSGVPRRVKVAVRLRPRNAEELVADADFADCVELPPEF